MRAQKQRNCVKDGFHHTIENNFFEVLDFFNSSKSGPSPTVLPLRFYHRQPKRTMFGFGLQTVIWSEYTRIISVLSDAKEMKKS